VPAVVLVEKRYGPGPTVAPGDVIAVCDDVEGVIHLPGRLDRSQLSGASGAVA